MIDGRIDWIAAIEACYRLDGDDQTWLDDIAFQVRPLLTHRRGLHAWTFRCTPIRLDIERFAGINSAVGSDFIRRGHLSAPPEWFDLAYRSGLQLGTTSTVLRARMTIWPEVERLTGGRWSEFLMATSHSGTGLGIAFGQALEAPRAPSARERRRWPLLAAHLGAALRLRECLASADAGLDDPAGPVEAVLATNGRLLHAQSSAVAGCAVRERLRQAALAIDRARLRHSRSDADASISAWTALVDGRWSLVDRFDADGRRIVLALKNDPSHPDPRGLTQVERQVAEFIGHGHSAVHIAYALGVTPSAVKNTVQRVQRKLGLTSLTDTVAFFAPGGLRRKMAEVQIAGQPMVLGHAPHPDESRLALLTPAEREVALHLLAGSTNADIARRRGSAERTVANQVAAVFSKLQARSRAELAARLYAAVPQASPRTPCVCRIDHGAAAPPFGY